MRKLLAVLMAFSPLLVLPAVTAAKDRLDVSFGEGGRVVRPTSLTGSAYGSGSKAAESPDGHTYAVLNEQTLLGFDPNGQVDTSFGADGAVAAFRPDELIHGPVSIAVDRKGRLLVAATVVPREEPDPNAEYQPEPVPEQEKAILVVRFTPAGQPDVSFGEDGRVVTRLGFPPPRVPANSLFGPGKSQRARVDTSGIAIDAAGRIVLSGTYLAGYEICPRGTYRSQRESFLARLDESGEPDPSFGGNGVTTLREGPVGAPVPDESGGVFASVGPSSTCETWQRTSAGYLFRLDGSGAPAASFGQGGWRVIPEDPQVKMLPDGRGGLLLMPRSPLWNRMRIVRRLRANGTWDARFGRGAAAEPFPAPRGTLAFTDAGIGRGGDIYVTGSWKRKARGAGAKRRFLLFRLDRRGRLDRRYGVLRTGFGKGTTALSRFLLITPGGNPLALGPIKSPLTGSEGLAMARYLP